MGGGFGLFGRGRGFDGCGGFGGFGGCGGFDGFDGFGCGRREREACCITAVRACKIKGEGFDGIL